jgi:hypothetical protein
MIFIPLSIEKCTFACWFSSTSIPSDLLYSPLNLTYTLKFLPLLPWANLPYTMLLTFHAQNLMFIFFRLGRLSKESVQVRGFLFTFVTGLFFTLRSCWPHARLLNSRTTPCRPSATAYSIYSQLPSITGGRLLYPQPEDVPCRGDKGPT